MPIFTAAVPADLIDAANQWAMCLAFGPADAQTYRAPVWTDAQGSLYAAASWTARAEWAQGAMAAPERPAWDEDGIVDLSAAAAARSALVLWAGEGEIPQAAPGAITVIAGLSGLEALAAMGLTAVDVEL